MEKSNHTLRVEFHCHTEFSHDSLTTAKQLISICRRRGIHRVVVTDHNTIAGALAAKELAPDLVIIGEEILTTEGELLAAYVREEVPQGLPPKEAIARLRSQGAFISVSHPYDVTRGANWNTGTLEQIAPLVDAIEVFNARCLNRDYNHKAAEFARIHRLPGTVGSDAHTPPEYGRATLLLLEFNDAEGLKVALPAAEAETRYSGIGVRVGSRYAALKHSMTR
jgi:predicted metal-dependent phosphoesterase TrpH